MTDRLQRFILRDASVRGEIVTLDAAWREVVDRHALPGPVRTHLGELSAAALLLAATLKFDGSLILQIHGDGPVALFVVECDTAGTFRATVKLREGVEVAEDATLRDLVDANGQGRFVVTLDPRQPNGLPGAAQTYQGIVPFDGNSVAQVLEAYMQRSEQVPTRLWLAADGQRAVGMLLQRMPGEGGHSAPADTDGWERMQHLADTLDATEMLTLPPQQVLHRLFWQESIEPLDERPWRFRCTCTRERVAGMLRTLGTEEVQSIIVERGEIEVRCEFCNARYAFDAVDARLLFAGDAAMPGSESRH